MHRAMDRNQPRIFLLESGDALCTAMRGAIVHDPENLAGLIVRRLPHDLVNQPLERGDTASALTTAKHLGAMPIEGSQVGLGAAAMVFMLDAHGRPRLGGQAGCLRTRAWMPVFSSAESTNSSWRRALPFQIRS